METSQAREKLQKVENELSGLIERKVIVTAKVDDLKGQREGAVASMARGDKGAKKRIEELNLKLESTLLDAEGLSILVQEAEKVLAEAKCVLKESEEEEKRAFEAFCVEKNRSECQQLILEGPARVERWIQSYISLCLELSEVQLAATRAAMAGIDATELQTLLFKLSGAVVQTIKDSKFTRLNTSGIAASIEIWPVVAKGNVLTTEIEKSRRQEREEVWKKEFEAKKGEKSC